MIRSKDRYDTKGNFDVCFISMSDISTDARTLNIARTLNKKGLSVCIIAFGEDNDINNLSAEDITLFKIEFIQTNKAYRRWIFFLRKARKYNKLVNAKVYWASDFFTLYTANKLSKYYNAEFYYDSREIYSAISSLSGRNIKLKIQSFLELKWIKNVDKIIVSGELDAEYLKKYFCVSIPYYVILNLPPYKDAKAPDLFRKKYAINKETKIILYQGMIIKGRGIIPVIKALPYIENAVFCLLGSGNLKELAIEEAKKLNIENRVIFCGRVNYNELHAWTSSADIGNCFIEPIAFSNELALPNKLFEYCMARLPSIVSDLPAMKEIIEKHPFAKLLPSNAEPKELADAITEMLIDENYKNYKRECEEAAYLFSYESQESTIMQIFEMLIEKKSRLMGNT